MLILIAILLIPQAILLISAARSHRRHLRIQSVLEEADRSVNAMGSAKTITDLKARGERIDELLEHARAMIDKK